MNDRENIMKEIKKNLDKKIKLKEKELKEKKKELKKKNIKNILKNIRISFQDKMIFLIKYSLVWIQMKKKMKKNKNYCLVIH